MNCESGPLLLNNLELEMLHEIGNRIAAADPLPEVLGKVVEVISAVVESDSYFVYVLEGVELVLRASKNPHSEVVDRLKLRLGQGITGWVAEHKRPVAVARDAFQDPRFRSFNELPEDLYQAFLSVPLMCRGRVMGVINLQHRQHHVYRRREIRLISTIGFLVGAEIELARLAEDAPGHAALEAELRQLRADIEPAWLERAKGILQRDLQLSEQEAYVTLQRQSRQRRKSMKEIAEAIVLSEDVKRTPGKPKPS